MTDQLTARQLEILHHTLGLRPDRRESYRNYFVASEGHHDIEVLRELEALGLMERVPGPSFLAEGSITFMVTGVGKAIALAHLPFPPQLTKYREWIARDCNYSFGDFLTNGRLPKFEQRGWSWERDVRYRMYREVWDDYDRCHYRDVQGEWMPTKKEAKVSYKIALAAHRNKMKELANA